MPCHVTPSAPHSPAHPALEGLDPHQAQAFLAAHPETLFIDIRIELEHFFVGHPPGVHNIPWLDWPDFEPNPDFLRDIRAVATMERPILLLCRSGHRSIDAGNFLLNHGFRRVLHVLEGFEGDRDELHHRSSINGWRFRGLPWVQC
ncbi:MAG: rhodanese-like domain-containing protein [Magnetococcus sp. WYHC-3]